VDKPSRIRKPPVGSSSLPVGSVDISSKTQVPITRRVTTRQLDKLSDSYWVNMRAMIKARNDKDRAGRSA
jgi:hypothetical protein